MPQLARRRNGHNPMETPFDGDNLSDIARTVQGIEMPSVGRDLVHPGKDIYDLLMRTVFRDDNQRNDVVALLHKCEEFGLERHIDMLANWLAAAPSVDGRSRVELLQASTGVIATDLNPISRLARRFGRKNDGEQDR